MAPACNKKAVFGAGMGWTGRSTNFFLVDLIFFSDDDLDVVFFLGGAEAARFSYSLVASSANFFDAISAARSDIALIVVFTQPFYLVESDF